MAPRRNGHDTRKRGDDDHPSWGIYDHDHIATTSSQPARPTDDDDDDYTQFGPPSSVTWEPTPGVILWTQHSTASTLVTSTTDSISQHAIAGPTATVTATAIASDDGPSAAASATLFPSVEGGSIGDPQRKEQSSHGPVYAAAGAIPVVVIAIIGFVVFFCMRKRRKQRQIAATQGQVVQEMKSQQPTVQAYRAPAIPISRAPSYTAPMHNMQRPTSPPPVILGPISAGSNGNYMTGIDTSDVMSTRNERTGLGDPFADGSSLHEEPPPPYKPRSLASRTSSLRIPRSSMSVSSQHSRHPSPRQIIQSLQNPFEDPREDDVVSDWSGATLHRDSDNMSVVSDLSYQQDAQVGRRAR